MMGRDEGSGMRAVTMSMGWGQVLLSRCLERRGWRFAKVVRRKPESASFQTKEKESGGGCLRSLGDGPLVAEEGGMGAEPDDGDGEGVFAPEGVDAVANLGEGHGVGSLFVFWDGAYGLGGKTGNPGHLRSISLIFGH